ncbi:hypothetical protein PAXRUDRAFT_158279, partial [Paxillus rubicundulus Ve08.2h10]
SMKYPLAMINKLINVCGKDQAISSEIGCQLLKTVATSSLCDKAKGSNLCLAVNAFHGHAHNHKCQLQNHPMYLTGFGLEDLETCKRVFSSSNSVVPLIHHASHFHYIQFLDLQFRQWDKDKYLKLSQFLKNNYKQAMDVINNNTKELNVYHTMFPDKHFNFEQWQVKELHYLQSVAMEPVHGAQAIQYVKALEKLWKVQYSFTPNSGLSVTASEATKWKNLVLVEDLGSDMNIEADECWTPKSPKFKQYIEYSRHCDCICTVETFESLVVQHLLELARANLASTGKYQSMVVSLAHVI